MSITRLNHFVSRYYQKKFYLPSNESFWIYDKSQPALAARLGHVSNSLAQNDLYTIEERDGTQNDLLEKFFTEVENSANPLLDHISNEKVYPSSSERQILARYLAYQHLRVPRHIDPLMKFFKTLIMEISNAMANDPILFSKKCKELGVDENVMRQSIKHDIPSIIPIPGNIIAATMDDFATTVQKLLLSMSWMICTTPEDSFFVTGDAPVVSFAKVEDAKSIYGANFLRPNVEVHFPLSYRKCIYMSHRPSPQFTVFNKPTVWELNNRCIYLAKRYVVSPFQSNHIKKFINKIFGHQTGPILNINTVQEFVSLALELDAMPAKGGSKSS